MSTRTVRSAVSPPPPQRRVKTSSSTQAYAKSFASAGPPVVPEMIAASILNHLQRLKLKRRREALDAICRFWSLKRESRRGAGFLKRLHLEPWTAKAQRGSHNSEVGEKKLELMKKLRMDLENVRTLCEHVKRRERLKLRRIEEVRKAVQPVLFPMEDALWEVLDEVGACVLISLHSQMIDAYSRGQSGQRGPLSRACVEERSSRLLRHHQKARRLDDHWQSHSKAQLPLLRSLQGVY